MGFYINFVVQLGLMLFLVGIGFCINFAVQLGLVLFLVGISFCIGACIRYQIDKRRGKL